MEPLIKSVSKALAVGKSEAAARLEIAAGPGVMSFHYNVDEKRKLLLGQGHCLGGVSTSCPRLCGFSPGLQLLPHPLLREPARLNSPSLSGCGWSPRPGLVPPCFLSAWEGLCPPATVNWDSGLVKNPLTCLY